MADEALPLSYNLCLFEFFAYYALKNPTQQNLCKFAIESLDFLKIEEARQLNTFIKIYSQVEVLFALLFKHMMALAMPDSHKLQEHWRRLYKVYLDEKGATSTDKEVKESVENKTT